MENFSIILKQARISKGLSQEALGKKVGLPQAHISKIESGAVNLQTSSLIELTRALDLEVMLIPRILIPIIEGLISDINEKKPTPRPLYQVSGEDNEE